MRGKTRIPVQCICKERIPDRVTITVPALFVFFFFKLRSTQLFFTYKALSLPRTKFNKNARVKPMMRQILSYLEPIVQLCSSISYKNRIEFSNNPTQFFILLSQNMHDHKNNNNNNNITSKTLIC